MTDAALADALGRLVFWVLAGGLFAFVVAEALRPYVAFADERARFRHVMVNLGLWLAGYALVDWWLVPWVAANVAFDPASALVGLASLPWWAQAVVGLFVIASIKSVH